MTPDQGMPGMPGMNSRALQKHKEFICFLRYGPSKRLKIIKFSLVYKWFSILHFFVHFTCLSILHIKPQFFNILFSTCRFWPPYWPLSGSKSSKHIWNYNVYCDRLKIITKTQGIIAFIAMWVTQLPKNIRNYNVYCDVALQEPLGVPKAPLGAPKSPLGTPKAALGTPNASQEPPRALRDLFKGQTLYK